MLLLSLGLGCRGGVERGVSGLGFPGLCERSSRTQGLGFGVLGLGFFCVKWGGAFVTLRVVTWALNIIPNLHLKAHNLYRVYEVYRRGALLRAHTKGPCNYPLNDRSVPGYLYLPGVLSREP